jgi:DNA-binding CsgD family transcriptional regulator
VTTREATLPEDPLRELLAVAREQLRWTRAVAIPQLRTTLGLVLNSTEKRRVYELCDGKLASKEIAERLGIPVTTISTWTREWRNLGLASQVEERRIQHIVSLRAIGLEQVVSED